MYSISYIVYNGAPQNPEIYLNIKNIFYSYMFKPQALSKYTS